MAITRKHINIVSGVLSRCMEVNKNNDYGWLVQHIASSLADGFKLEDESFDKKRFLKDCGVIS